MLPEFCSYLVAPSIKIWFELYTFLFSAFVEENSNHTGVSRDTWRTGDEKKLDRDKLLPSSATIKLTTNCIDTSLELKLV